MFVYVLFCSHGTSLHCRLLGRNTYCSVLSFSCKCKNTKGIVSIFSSSRFKSHKQLPTSREKYVLTKNSHTLKNPFAQDRAKSQHVSSHHLFDNGADCSVHSLYNKASYCPLRVVDLLGVFLSNDDPSECLNVSAYTQHIKKWDYFPKTPLYCNRVNLHFYSRKEDLIAYMCFFLQQYC